MPKIQYIDHKFSPGSLVLIDQANEILEDYNERGYDLTLRQLYYQFVARDMIANKATEYKRLGAVVNDARLAGLIDWDFLVDRTRNLQTRSHWNSPNQIVAACASQYHEDMWEHQGAYVEAWVEKDALVGILEKACGPLDVPYFSCRGYGSQSEMWAAGVRLMRQSHKRITILHLGDHDPSGMDMTRDIEDRLRLLSNRTEITVHRIALNMDQIDEYKPPPNPTKITDSRASEYILQFGASSWELDALDPDVLVALVTRHIQTEIDQAQWKVDEERITERRGELKYIANNWEQATRGYHD